MQKLIPIVKRHITYETVYYNLVDFLKQQQSFDLVYNREEETIDLRLPTKVEQYTHYVGHIPFADLPEGALDWLYKLTGDCRELEFVIKYQNSFVFIEEFRECVIDTSNL